jgi:hypothetical protein
VVLAGVHSRTLHVLHHIIAHQAGVHNHRVCWHHRPSVERGGGGRRAQQPKAQAKTRVSVPGISHGEVTSESGRGNSRALRPRRQLCRCHAATHRAQVAEFVHRMPRVNEPRAAGRRVCGSFRTPPKRVSNPRGKLTREGFGTARQKMALERGTAPKLSRRTRRPRYGLQSRRGESAGVAKRRREMISHPIPQSSNSQGPGHIQQG